MDIILMLIPAALMFSVVALLVFRWSVKSDQYDDMEGESYRILMDNEDMIPGRDNTNKLEEAEEPEEASSSEAAAEKPKDHQ